MEIHSGHILTCNFPANNIGIIFLFHRHFMPEIVYKMKVSYLVPVDARGTLKHKDTPAQMLRLSKAP